jgi:hypothetical protein
MSGRIDHAGEYSFTHTAKIFISGMFMAFLISIFISYNEMPDLISETSSVDCSNRTSLMKAQDRSRNGIANGCPNQSNNLNPVETK